MHPAVQSQPPPRGQPCTIATPRQSSTLPQPQQHPTWILLVNHHNLPPPPTLDQPPSLPSASSKNLQPSHQQQPRDPSWGQGSTSRSPRRSQLRAPYNPHPNPRHTCKPTAIAHDTLAIPLTLPGGGWSSPGLTPGSGSTSPRYPTTGHGSLSPGAISWASAKAKSDEVRSYPSFSTRNSGFFSRQKRKISASLPRFSLSRDFREQEKLGRGRSSGSSTGWRSRDNVSKGGWCRLWKCPMGGGRFRLLFSLLLGLVLYLNVLVWYVVSTISVSENSTN